MSTRTDSLLKQILRTQCKIEELLGSGGSTPTSSNQDVEVTCISNDGGTTSVSGVVVYDLTVSPPAETIYLNGVNVSSTYTKVPCTENVKYDLEKNEICVDGKTWTKWYIWNSNTKTIDSIIWMDETDSVVLPPNSALINNENCINNNQIGIEQYSNLGNGTQNSSFNANEITITYDAPVFTNTPLIATIIASNLQGGGQFKVQPNTQETRKFKYPNITGVIITNAVGNNVIVEFQLN